MCVLGVRAGCGSRQRHDSVVRGDERAGWFANLPLSPASPPCRMARLAASDQPRHTQRQGAASGPRQLRPLQAFHGHGMLGGIRVSICSSRQTRLPGSTSPNGSSAASPRIDCRAVSSTACLQKAFSTNRQFGLKKSEALHWQCRGGRNFWTTARPGTKP